MTKPGVRTAQMERACERSAQEGFWASCWDGGGVGSGKVGLRIPRDGGVGRMRDVERGRWRLVRMR